MHSTFWSTSTKTPREFTARRIQVLRVFLGLGRGCAHVPNTSDGLGASKHEAAGQIEVGEQTGGALALMVVACMISCLAVGLVR